MNWNIQWPQFIWVDFAISKTIVIIDSALDLDSYSSILFSISDILCKSLNDHRYTIVDKENIDNFSKNSTIVFDYFVEILQKVWIKLP